MAAIPQTQTVAWVDTPQAGAQLRIRHDVPVPSIGQGEVLVKLEYTGFWCVNFAFSRFKY